jgi:hypothetical protein
MPATGAEGIYIVWVTWMGLQGKILDPRLVAPHLLHAQASG